MFNNSSVSQLLSQKTPGCYTWHLLNIWWTSKNNIFKNKENLRTSPKLQSLLPRSTLITINIKPSSDPIYIMVISFMINLMVCPFTKNWNLFSIMLAWPWLVRYEVSLSKNVNKSTLELFSGTFEFRYPGAMTFIEKKYISLDWLYNTMVSLLPWLTSLLLYDMRSK